jgi:hypothetical protein
MEHCWGSLKPFRGEDVHNDPALRWRGHSQEIAYEQGPRGLRICGATSGKRFYMNHPGDCQVVYLRPADNPVVYLYRAGNTVA